jgi:hypothetical protein
MKFLLVAATVLLATANAVPYGNDETLLSFSDESGSGLSLSKHDIEFLRKLKSQVEFRDNGIAIQGKLLATENSEDEEEEALISLSPHEINPGYASINGKGVAFRKDRVSLTNNALSDKPECSYMSFGPTHINLATSGITIAARFQFTSNAYWERLVDFNNGPHREDIFLGRRDVSNILSFKIGGDSLTSVLEPNFEFKKNVIYKVVAVYNPALGATGRLIMYMNGQEIGNVAAVSKYSDNLYQNSWVGRSSYIWDGCLSADIYSLKIYDKVVPVNEISWD